MSTIRTYHCIGGCMGDPRHHVERTWASDMMWIVPGTYPEDPATDAAGAMAHAATNNSLMGLAVYWSPAR